MKRLRFNRVWISLLALFIVVSSLTFYNVFAETNACESLDSINYKGIQETDDEDFQKNNNNQVTKYVLDFVVEGDSVGSFSVNVQADQSYTLKEKDMLMDQTMCWHAVEVTRGYTSTDTYEAGSVLMYDADFDNVLIRLVPTEELRSEQWHTVLFKVGIDTFSEVFVKQGDVLSIPQSKPVSSIEGAVFSGWYIDAACTKQFNFDDPIVGGMTLYAGFTNSLIVSFKDALGAIYETMEVVYGDLCNRPGENPAPIDSGVNFQYWTIEGDDTGTEYTFDQPIYKNITLIPFYSSTNKVNFISNNKIYHEVTVGMDVTIDAPTNPSRNGYEFIGWSVDANSQWDQPETFFDFSAVIIGTITVYSIWKPVSVAYKIVYWHEIDDLRGDPGTNLNNYTHSATVSINQETSELMAGTVLSEPMIKALADTHYQTAIGLPLNPNNLTGSNLPLMFSEYSFAPSVTINGDGTTCLNVYY